VITDSWVRAAIMRSAPRRQKGQVAISSTSRLLSGPLSDVAHRRASPWHRERRRGRRERSRDGPRLPCRAPSGSDHVVRRWPKQEPCVHPTYNSAVSEVTGHVLSYAVHMCTMQAKNRCRQGQPSRCTTHSRCRRRRQLYVCGTPAQPSPVKEEDRSPRRGHWGWAMCRPRCYARLAARPVCAAHGGPDRVAPAGGRGGPLATPGPGYHAKERQAAQTGPGAAATRNF
jgi:hypothetical protein